MAGEISVDKEDSGSGVDMQRSTDNNGRGKQDMEAINDPQSWRDQPVIRVATTKVKRPGQYDDIFSQLDSAANKAKNQNHQLEIKYFSQL
uniref:Uncharacterized protein n=1 Tax=Romanomermis culicivorax TaxID=13658 RepID=A0A915IE16_ROMCU